MLRTSTLCLATLLLTACDPEPPTEATAPGVAAAEPHEKEPFTPPANAKVIPMGEPRMIPVGPPGKSAAPLQTDPRVSCRSTRATMTRRFGPEQISDREVDLGEGEVGTATVVGEGTPMAQEVVWFDGDRLRVERIRVLGDGIRDPSGLGLGSTVAELETALGPFELHGFGWDYEGTVSLKGTKLERLQGKLFFRLAPRSIDGPEVQAALAAVAGDALFPSSDPDVKTLDLVVGSFEMLCPKGPLPLVPNAPTAP